MKLACFVMMRNERPILGPFTDQLGEFFDHVILVDHSSDDGSLETVRDKRDNRFHIFRLEAKGYPQSQIATKMTRVVFSETPADWLFFLDCDEFLPFDDRTQLEAGLQSAKSGLVYMNWRNIVPCDLSGGDIFSGRFKTLSRLSQYKKIAVSKDVVSRFPNLVIQQGYHGVTHAEGLDAACLSPAGLYHIPVQSRKGFTSKISRSARRLLAERHLLSIGLGAHWVECFDALRAQGIDNFDFEATGLFYPDPPTKTRNVSLLPFKFPYVKSRYQEREILLEELSLQSDELQVMTEGTGFKLMELQEPKLRPDHKASAISSLGNDSATSSKRQESIETKLTATAHLIRPLVVQDYSTLVEPLFSLPLRLPTTAWSGHVPFLFVLFKMMRPKSYVELGVHYGASLIAAGTAARAYQIPMKIWGIDSWEGDDHSGLYQGDGIFTELAKFVDKQFGNIELMRCLFDKANSRFADESIDVLHIDGLHSYEAVKHDFDEWLPKVSADGVILLHDTAVKERDFGVYKFWSELEKQYSTFHFFHSHGLGAVFKDNASPRVTPLIEISQSAEATSFYQMLTSDIASLIKPRMEWLESPHEDNIDQAETFKELEDELRAARAYARAIELNSRKRIPGPYRFKNLG
jgi:Methyltransferase domain/Glycosyl transferase family 2